MPLRKAELIQDGKVIATKQADAAGGFGEAWQFEIAVERSGWIALRTSGPAHADNPGGEAFAHANPIYVEVAGTLAAARDDAESFVRWVDRLDVALRERNRFPNPAQKAHVADQLRAARAVFLKIAAR